MLLASMLCLPIYLYFAVPGLFRCVFGGGYTVPLQAGVVWGRWTVTGILAIVIAMGFALRALGSVRR
jgi:hypothetical protein